MLPTAPDLTVEEIGTTDAPDAPAAASAPPAEPPVPAAAVPADVPLPGSSPHPVADLSPAACAALLAERFPELFGAGRALPIKLRIQADIQQRAPGVFSKKSLSLFLHRHTTSTAYLKALVSSPSRYDLDGVAAGELIDEHRQAAAAEIERRRGLFEARRAAERAAQRAAFAAQRGPTPAPDKQAPLARAPRHPHPRQHPPQQRQDPPAPAARPRYSAAELQAQRERSALLRAFETTTLTAANFCALKGIAVAQLDAKLALARRERAERAQEPQPAHAGPAPKLSKLPIKPPR